MYRAHFWNSKVVINYSSHLYNSCLLCGLNLSRSQPDSRVFSRNSRFPPSSKIDSPCIILPTRDYKVPRSKLILPVVKSALWQRRSICKRVSMELTVNRQMGQKLTVSRQKRNIFTVNRQLSEPKSAVKFLRYP